MRRAVGLATAVVLGSGAALAGAPSATADQDDATAGADWLASQLVDGDHLERFGSPDVGLTIDAALALQEVGGEQPTVTAIRDFVADNLADYALPYDDGSFSFTPVNQTAKTAALAVDTGADPEDFGGSDLVDVVEDVTRDRGRLAGRISERGVFNGDPQPDQANTFGQAFAAHALTAAGSPEAPAVRDFLLSQQCRAGFFRLGFSSAGKKDQSCDAATKATGHVDATAITVIELDGVPGRAARRAQARAVTWLQRQQGSDGSFVDAPGSSGPNANSTGLAAWALDQEGATAPARKAARWLHDHQLTDAAGCSFAAADLGAIAYDDAAYEVVQDGTIAGDGDADQFARATAQALPGLLAVPAKHEVAPCA